MIHALSSFVKYIRSFPLFVWLFWMNWRPWYNAQDKKGGDHSWRPSGVVTRLNNMGENSLFCNISVLRLHPFEYVSEVRVVSLDFAESVVTINSCAFLLNSCYSKKLRKFCGLKLSASIQDDNIWVTNVGCNPGVEESFSNVFAGLFFNEGGSTELCIFFDNLQYCCLLIFMRSISTVLLNMQTSLGIDTLNRPGSFGSLWHVLQVARMWSRIFARFGGLCFEAPFWIKSWSFDVEG